ncbi:response regulator transcription factor [Oceanomicrobium pacificus]|uniref:Response regulator n=1 Tax=Oceanomicrobium pacificus TaxID=2692916 RepID=A0A6B0TQ67_9RHOB|nr:response regulator transcription factor [Oceanomicrobium pacificus]MXU63928.1 response regulator [Oceanomicrobium pacificus]
MRILVIEDDAVLRNQIVQALKGQGMVTDTADNGEDGLHLAETEVYDAIVLDLGLPVRDGLSVLRALRDAGDSVPVAILTARARWTERVDGLDAGADDYIVKPFHMAELMARIRALVRRSQGAVSDMFELGDVSVDLSNGTVFRNGLPVDLTRHEHSLLAHLVRNAGRYISTHELADHIYGYDSERDSNTVAVFVARLRKKLGADLIRSSRGRGYQVPGP